MNHQRFIDLAAAVALQSTCARKRCGSIIVVNETVVGSGFNSPPPDTPHRCLTVKASLAHPRADRTCCVHAEQRALFCFADWPTWPNQKPRLYFARLDDAGKLAPSGHPYCTACSRLALDRGIHEWVMLTTEGIRVWPAALFDELSHQEPTP